MLRALLDVNVLIALLDAQHIHNSTANAWLARNINAGWASCPITQNGLVRILSQPAYPAPVTPLEAASRLREACATEWHEFWPDDVSLVGNQQVDWQRVLGSRQLTDVYLLALAVEHGGCFVTLDRKVPLDAVQGANAANLVVIA